MVENGYCSTFKQSHLEEGAPHPRHVHKHHARVDARPAVERVPSEAAVPGDAGLLVLWGHSGQLRRVQLGQEGP